jgi:D-tyrosyl-tRNA(Tyr) deacylase
VRLLFERLLPCSHNKGEPVLLGLGGGHYTPRHGDVARYDGSLSGIRR